MNQKKNLLNEEQQEQILNNADNLKWEKKIPNKGILDLLQPIVGNFVLLIEEERKRTLDKLEKTKNTLDRMKNNR